MFRWLFPHSLASNFVHQLLASALNWNMMSDAMQNLCLLMLMHILCICWPSMLNSVANIIIHKAALKRTSINSPNNRTALEVFLDQHSKEFTGKICSKNNRERDSVGQRDLNSFCFPFYFFHVFVFATEIFKLEMFQHEETNKGTFDALTIFLCSVMDK